MINGTIPLSSVEETLAAGRIFGSFLPPNSVIALSGNLGAGKTSFTQGVAVGLQIGTPIQSPTFVYLNSYEGRIPLFHFDLYRMKDSSDFLGLGLEEYFDKEGVCVIEWPEKISSFLPEHTLTLSLSHCPEGRLLSISGVFPQELIESLPICH